MGKSVTIFTGLIAPVILYHLLLGLSTSFFRYWVQFQMSFEHVCSLDEPAQISEAREIYGIYTYKEIVELSDNVDEVLL